MTVIRYFIISYPQHWSSKVMLVLKNIVKVLKKVLIGFKLNLRTAVYTL